VPAEVVTVTSTVPAEPAGAIAEMDVALLTVNVVAAVVPNFTAVAPVRFVPVITTEVPPPVGPVLGLTAVTVGVLDPDPEAVMSTASDDAVPAGDWAAVGDTAPETLGSYVATLPWADTA
jgi:hypothetical protein